MKHAAASKRNGVVGITGKNIPITPKITLNQPTMISTALIIFLLNLINADMPFLLFITYFTYFFQHLTCCPTMLFTENNILSIALYNSAY
jgi:hypothetical protein